MTEIVPDDGDPRLRSPSDGTIAVGRVLGDAPAKAAQARAVFDTRQHTVQQIADASEFSRGTATVTSTATAPPRGLVHPGAASVHAAAWAGVDPCWGAGGERVVAEAVLRTVGAMREVMTSAMRKILTPDELIATRCTAVREPAGARHPALHVVPPFEQWPRVADEDLLDDQITMRVRVFSDSIGIRAGGGRATAAELHERFRSDLQDFVAQSTSGWGQWRP